ncbi:putative calcium-transporting ATPase 7, plasma membrane-type isoform X1 [Rosa chinensis]|uniref:putative calcium-transporting ATPase 7, plasma membrane-type isoform X1 n=1 Tax=Rosa chinensis TaxID=74649 RepID=UPI001AD89F8A|nr:putative calcium-transporting ATPase 7, plasma membrane-type isoform X1 [Rosa chinensis]
MKMGIERVLKEKFADALKDIQQVFDEENRETTVEVLKGPNAPFLMSGCKIADGVGTMLVTSVGSNTGWGLLMASISEDTGEEAPLQASILNEKNYRRYGIGASQRTCGLQSCNCFFISLFRLILSTHYPIFS